MGGLLNFFIVGYFLRISEAAKHKYVFRNGSIAPASASK
jgi:hypothetical protein